jgi:hypothetical protein
MTLPLASMSLWDITDAIADAVEARYGAPDTGIAPSFVIEPT